MQPGDLLGTGAVVTGLGPWAMDAWVLLRGELREANDPHRERGGNGIKWRLQRPTPVIFTGFAPSWEEGLSPG